MDDVLLFGWDGSFAASAVEVGVAPEACSEYRHEGVILLGVHVGLEVGEAEGVVDGLRAAVVWAVVVGCGSFGVDEAEQFLCLDEGGVGHLVEACGCFGTVAVDAHGIVYGQCCVDFLWHGLINVFADWCVIPVGKVRKCC